MSFRGQASWAKMTSPGGAANSTGMPPDQKCKASWGANLSLSTNIAQIIHGPRTYYNFGEKILKFNFIFMKNYILLKSINLFNFNNRSFNAGKTNESLNFFIAEKILQP
jgi:hypothetical protein